MEGFAFLFRIPNAATRNRVINQKLWQIEGQTMFVDKWEPGIVPVKPELTTALIWLELRKVPFQFFNEDGLERIAGLVGHPKFLHPMTANKTNLEVAKVWTIIDPRKPLPEAVNVQFESGEICRVLVSCPWMPPVCDLCKEIGHTSKRCPKAPKAPKTCSTCKSEVHGSAECPLRERHENRGRKTRRSKSKDKRTWVPVDTSTKRVEQVQPPELTLAEQAVEAVTANLAKPPDSTPQIVPGIEKLAPHSKLGTITDQVRGETSGSASYLSFSRNRSGSPSASLSDAQPDSSDLESSDSDLEEGEFSRHEPDFEVVRYKKKFSGQKGKRGRGPIIN